MNASVLSPGKGVGLLESGICDMVQADLEGWIESTARGRGREREEKRRTDTHDEADETKTG